LIAVDNVSLSYGGHQHHQALANISMDVKSGESMALIGPSGCGKSSLLFLIAGLVFPQRGKILVADENVAGPRQDVALIIQNYGLFPWKTVWDNVILGLKLRKLDHAKQKQKVSQLLNVLGLADYQDKYPNQLSGGQQQRVAVARALALEPMLLLMDEPFSALDALTRESLQEMVLDIWLENKMTLVFVTHSIEEAVFLGQKIAIFTPGPGRITTIVENSGMGAKEFRATKQFYQQCSKVRKLLEDGQHESA